MQDKNTAMEHLKDHQTYPATKSEMVMACDNLSHFSKEDKKWFMDNLPDRTYNSANEAITALGW